MNEQNIAWCTQAAHNIGSTVYHNVCTGTFYKVPWGSLDWAQGVVAFSGLAFAAATISFVGYMIYRSIKEVK